MRYDPERHYRRSIRLKDYDYNRAGAYFVTIVVRNRTCVLGQIQDSKLQLSEVGAAVQSVVQELPDGYPGVILDAYIVMPNHVHFIVIITKEAEAAARANEAAISIQEAVKISDEAEAERRRRRRMLLPKLVGRFKMNASKQANLILGSPGQPFWQRGYYEHIIREKTALNRIRTYIRNNPTHWPADQLHPDNPT